ncbi:reverse transcriptase domain-containing protein [Tanacetum coccineum]
MDNIILNNKEWKESDSGNPHYTTTDSFFKAYDEHDIDKGNVLRQMKCKKDIKNDEQPNKRLKLWSILVKISKKGTHSGALKTRHLKDYVISHPIRLEKALQRYGVTHKLSTAYHPQTNGKTKVTNRAIKRILERSVGYNLKNWSEKLDDALWAFRTAYKTPTGCTPFRLVYGKSCHLPVEIEHKAYWALKQCNMELTAAAKNRIIKLNEFMELRDGAYENNRIYKVKTKKWHDSRLSGDKDFKVGDKIIDRNGISFKVNGQRLKKYHDKHTDAEDKEVVEFEQDTT